MNRHTTLAAALFAVALACPAAAQVCAGDCNGDGQVSISELVRAVRISLGQIDGTECSAADRDGDRRVSVAELVTAVRRALEGCAADRQAFIVASDFASGSFAAIGLEAPRPVSPVSAERRIHEDAVARDYDGHVYVLNRRFRDTVQRLDPQRDFASEIECRVGERSNPVDIAFLNPRKAYVSRLDEHAIWIVDPSATNCDEFKLGEIDLSGAADADGNPDMDQMAIVRDRLGVRLYVALQRLDIGTILREPAGNGAIAVIDTATDTLVDVIELSGENPFAATKGLVVHNDQLFIAEAGRFGTADGGLERVDLGSAEASGFVVGEADLGGDITDFVIVDDRLAYAIVSTASGATSLVSFDPSGGGELVTLTSRNGFDLWDIEVNDRLELFLADRTRERPGVRVYDAISGIEKTEQPIDIGLPPTEILFIR